MPHNVAVECPNSRVVSNKADEAPTVSRDSKGISAWGIGEGDRGDTRQEKPVTLAKDPKDMTMKMEPMSHQHQLVEPNTTMTHG